MDKEIRRIKIGDLDTLLNEIPDKPEEIYVQGELPSRDFKYLCVVGSRKLSPYGKMAIEKIIGGLAGYKIAIISGLAIGADKLLWLNCGTSCKKKRNNSKKYSFETHINLPMPQLLDSQTAGAAPPNVQVQGRAADRRSVPCNTVLGHLPFMKCAFDSPLALRKP